MTERLSSVSVAVAAVALLAAGQLHAQTAPAHRFALVTNSPAFWRLIPKNAKLRTMGTGFGFTERPAWDKSGWSRTGKHLGTIELPEQPANLAWGGPTNSTLYITAVTSAYVLDTSTTGFVPYELHARQRDGRRRRVQSQ